MQSSSELRAAASDEARNVRSIPSLDGLRARSIALVIFSHLGNEGVVPARLAAVTNTYLAPGALGVRVFFVISGFLITTLLLREFERSGSIDLARFYLRRTLRIFPPYYAYLAVLWVLARTHIVNTAPGDFVHALTYTVNSFAGLPGRPSHSEYVGHAWSLSIEEQFYLLWPAVLLAVGVRRGWRAAAVVVALGPVVKTALYVITPPAGRPTVPSSFLGVIDYLAVGCVLAGLRPALHRTRWYQRVLSSRRFWLIVPIALVCWRAFGHPKVTLVTDSLFLIGLALCLDRVITYPAGRVGRVLNWPPVAWVGRLSYSLYLWQQLFTLRVPTDVVLKNAGLLNAPINLVVIAVCAVASYYAIERPSLRLRAAIEQRRFRARTRPAAGEHTLAPSP